MYRQIIACVGLGISIIALICARTAAAAAAVADCPTGDCVSYDITTQAQCTEVTEGRTDDGRWGQGLSTNVDQTVKGGEIVAYQIQWFNGNWSEWYVTGVNDIDAKYNPHDSTMRRRWSYFYDHTHKYIICK